MNAELSRRLSLTEIEKALEEKIPDAQVQKYSEGIIDGFADQTTVTLETVLESAFASPLISKDFDPGSIRHAARAFAAAQDALNKLDIDAPLHDLTVGTIQLPKTVAALVAEINMVAAMLKDALVKQSTGYDMSGAGHPIARQQAIALLDRHYGFPEDLMATAIEKNIIGPGGMRMLNDTFVAGREWFLQQGLKPDQIIFCTPDNSFGTTFQLEANNRIGTENHALASVESMRMSPENGLHYSAEDVNQFYDKNEGKSFGALWYLTPLGNPSGTKIAPQQLLETLNAIATRDAEREDHRLAEQARLRAEAEAEGNTPELDRNYKSIIVLDMVYVRTLKPEEAKKLLQAVWDSPAAPQVVFIDSLSKTHGLCNLRIADAFSIDKDDANPAEFQTDPKVKPSKETFFSFLQKKNMEVGAGNGIDKDALWMALGSYDNEELALFDELHQLWAAELKALYEKLIANGDFDHLFDQQEHIIESDLENPGGLYLFLKLKDGVDPNQVVIETSCFGVPTKMLNPNTGVKDVQYVRYSVGRTTEPVFSNFQSSTLLPQDFKMPSTRATTLKALDRFESVGNF